MEITYALAQNSIFALTFCAPFYRSFMLYLLNTEIFCAFMMPLIYKSQSNLNNHNILQNENYFCFITGETGTQGTPSNISHAPE